MNKTLLKLAEKFKKYSFYCVYSLQKAPCFLMAQEFTFDVRALPGYGMQEKAMPLYSVKTEDGARKYLFVGQPQPDASFQVTFFLQYVDICPIYVNII